MNSSGVATPSLREVISYTGINGNDLTGCTRGADGSTAQSHSDTAIVETVPTVGMWNNLATIVSAGFTGDGYLKAISSPVSLTRGEFTQFVTPSIASIAEIRTPRVVVSAITIVTSINASGASVLGFGSGTGGFNALFQIPGSLASQANAAGLVPVPTAFTGQFMQAFVRTPSSVASIGIHILKNMAVYGVCEIVGGATFASSASIGSAGLAAGDVLTLDIRSTASLGADLSVLLRAT